jgi:release factor glutamine methyltransferase
MSKTLSATLRESRNRLAEAAIPEAALDARIIVEHFAGIDRAAAVLRPETPIDPARVAAILDAVARRAAGEPVHRILGYREFHGLRLALSPETLEPRADTETLVDAALPFVRETAARHGTCRILDLGTGTGAVALALLKEEPLARALVTDISEDALSTAMANARSNGLEDRFETLKSNWFSAVSGRFHMIVSNPPYIASDEIGALQREVRLFDPPAALDGGPDGLDAYRAIAGGAAGHLETAGRIAVETGFLQKRAVDTIFGHAGYRLVEATRDLGGNDRVLIFARPKA